MGRHRTHRGSPASLLAGALALVALAVPGALAAPAAAQDGERSAARRDFDAGMAAIAEGRFAEGRDALARSLEADARPATAYNLGVALRGTGQVRQGSEVLRALIAGEYGELSAEGRAQAERLLSEVRADVASLRVAVAAGEGAGDAEPARGELSLDGEPIEEVEAGSLLLLRVDPGAHRLQLAGVRIVRVTRSIELAPGEERDVSLRLQPRPDAPAPSRFGRRLAISLAVIAAAAGALTLGLLLRPTDEPSIDPQVGRFESALRF